MVTVSKKICMVGDFGVGKTSLIRRFVEREFSDRYLSTVGVKISRKVVPLPPMDDVDELKLLIWDLEGQTKFKAITPTYLQGSSGVLIVADVTRPETIDHIEDHLQLFFGVNPAGWVAIALNKTDLLDSDERTHVQTSLELNRPQILGPYLTSAKTGDNVDAIFTELAKEMLA
ncbi:MAG: GTP-binding protein [Spirulina sp. DLM2.Bin59]|nr:MAG: GTP-binding protein [Spirulina sp. DLM2.Bin59]